MKKITINTIFSTYESKSALSEEVQFLMEQAISIRKNAYAPYSKFRVGCAILLDNGKVVLGSNQENAAYPSGLCAERVAIFQAGSLYPDSQILKMAISATSDEKPVLEPIPPCGSCRQSIAEYEIKQEAPIEIFFMGESGNVYQSDSLRNLLPFMFDKKFL
jgi:cytidine deaminase